MGKGNLFLGFARGKVGDIVYSRANGQQVFRARNASPRNPQTAQQLLQRVILKTVAGAYSYFKPICDHAFQGFEPGLQNQSRFAKVNIDALRTRLAELIARNDPEEIASSTEGNFAAKLSRGCEANSYIISEGTLPSLVTSPDVRVGFNVSLGQAELPINPASGYSDFIQALGIQTGDQLTFVMATVNDSDEQGAGVFTSVSFARVIMQPNDGDLSSTFLTPVVGEEQVFRVNHPNEKNEGTVYFTIQAATQGEPAQLTVLPFPGMSGDPSGGMYQPYAFACILSRKVGGVWMRSNSKLILKQSDQMQYDPVIDLLGDAVLSFVTEENSALYLNQSANLKRL